MDKVEMLEEATKLAAERLYQQKQEMRRAMGSKPFGGGEMTDDEAFTEYLAVRINPQAYQQMIQENSKQGRDGRMLVRKELVDAIVKMETRIKEGA